MPWTARDALYAVALVVGGSGLVVLAVVLLRGDRDPGDSTLLQPMALATLPAILVLAVWVFGIRKHSTSWRSAGFARAQGRWAFLLPFVALMASLGFAVLYAVVVEALGIDALVPPGMPDGVLGEGLYRAVNTVTIGIAGPIAEETFFRGFLLASLIPRLGRPGAVAASSAVFAAFHLQVGLMVPFFVSGLLLAWLYVRSRSIWPPFVAHAAQNLIVLSIIP